VLIKVQAFDWNCPQQITSRFKRAEINEALVPVRFELAVGDPASVPFLHRALTTHTAALDFGTGGMAEIRMPSGTATKSMDHPSVATRHPPPILDTQIWSAIQASKPSWLPKRRILRAFSSVMLALGEVVGLHLPNAPEFPLPYFAALRARAIAA
jgi:hypothetical protein